MSFNPFAPEVVADPYPHYARLREDRVAYLEAFDTYVIAGHPEVSAAVRDHQRLSSAEGVTLIRAGLPMMLTMDPPDHERLRRIVGREFSPRRSLELRPAIGTMVASAVDALLADGGGEIVERLAIPLPIGVMGAIFGLDAGDLPALRRMADDLVEGFTVRADETGTSPGTSMDLERTMRAITDIHAYFAEVIAERRRSPGEDLLSRMLLPAEHDGALDEQELLWFCLLLIVAGIETTTNLIGNMLMALLDHPAQWERLRADPDLCASAVSEALRYDAPIQGFHRTVTSPYPIGDVEAPAGARVLLLFGAANRDPARYADPDRFDITRDASDHLAFGGGIHRCLGAGLAELEGAAVLEAFAVRVRAFAPSGEIVRTGHPTLRGARTLPLAMEAA